LTPLEEEAHIEAAIEETGMIEEEEAAFRLSEPKVLAELQTAREQYQQLLGRVKKLYLSCSTESAPTVLGKTVIPSTLTSLRLSTYEPVLGSDDSSEALVDALQRFTALEMLRFDHEHELDQQYVHEVWYNLSFPALKHLHLDTYGLEWDGDSEILKLAGSLAPNLESLFLDTVDDNTVFHRTPLPHLRHLRLSGYTHFEQTLPSIAHLPIESLEFVDEVILSSVSSVLPTSLELSPTLRHLHLTYLSPTPLSDLPTVRFSLAAKGIAFSSTWQPILDTFTNGPSSVLDIKSRARLILEELEWARERTEGLLRAGDEVGLREMVEGLVRIRQNRILQVH
jgi:hypothetical protein